MVDSSGREDALAVREAVASRARVARHEEDAAQLAAARAVGLRRLWVGIGDEIAAGRVVAALLECERGLEKASELADEDMALLQRAAATMREEVDKVLREIETRMPEELRSHGLSLDVSARHPNYTMEQGFITVHVDERKLVASISSRGGVTRKEPLDPDFVAGVATEVRNRVFRRKASHVTPAKLTQAYRSLVRKRPGSAGADVPVDAIRLQLSPRGKPIPQDEYNVDLAALVRTASQIGRPLITLSNTRDTRTGLLLHGLEEAGYVGYVRVEEG